jgi:putative ABC transport system ATP-binding protein
VTRALLTCRAVTRTYGAGETAFTAVRGVTCEVDPNSRIALTGPSGSGKSTLLHLMAGLDAATSGSVEWPVFGEHPSARADLVGVVFQGPSLIPALNVVENVGLPMILSGVDGNDAEVRARAALELLELEPLVDKLPDELSSGQAQRVAVARVLAAAPRLVLADEPTGQLDRGNAAMVIDVLLKVCEELGAALVVSTHDPLVSDRLSIQWAMHDGVLLPRDCTDPADQR